MIEIYAVTIQVEVSRGNDSPINLEEGICRILHDCHVIDDRGGSKYFRGKIIPDSIQIKRIE